MKILVMSDVHGMIRLAERMIDREQPDEVVFCGDGLRDVEESAKFLKNIRFHCVQGNCDFFGNSESLFITLGGKNIFITHGHRFHVKMEVEVNYITLRSHAAGMGADIVLFGHTHKPELIYMSGMVMMNPGAVQEGKYGVIELNGDSIQPELRKL